MAISVVVTVGEQTSEKLLETMKPMIQNIRIDAGDAAKVDMGPLISAPHRDKLLSAIQLGCEEGANLVIDGRDYKHPSNPNGYFLGPCLFDNVTESMSVYQNELFGPVLIVVHQPDFESALALVNRNQYGNGTAIFTRDGYTAREFSQRVQAGMVGVNIPIPVPIASHPFGGWKRSVFGDTNMHGPESIAFYTKRKTITQRWPVTDLSESAFIMPTH